MGKDYKNRMYYGHFRGSILEHVPTEARRVLSVGCGEGVTEAELVKRGAEVVGIELNNEAAVAGGCPTYR
jgi:16S rRNA A1518/A1519 N6-dimethyltransferase RsmA/KsgA/DIM1 with predicted DNA glycosylase/AP lyase activity